jgi:hypothetical protein
MPPVKHPLSWAALVILTLATVTGHYWIWGALILYWAYTSLQGGEAFLIETIGRAQNPGLFWLIIAMWAVFGLWYVLADLPWRLGLA